MLDPLTALSTASAVVQLIDFSTKVLDDSYKLYTDGSLVTLEELKSITKDLIEVNNYLLDRPRPKDCPSDPVSQAEKDLDTLCTKCSESAVDLITCLQSLDTQSGIRLWNSFRTALLSRWELHHIREMEAQMKSFREQLAVRILAVLNTRTFLQASRQEERFDHLDQSHADVIDVVAINRELVQSTMRSNTSKLSHAISQLDTNQQVRHNEIIAAILQLKDGNSKVLTRQALDQRSSLGGARPIRETIMTLQPAVLNHTEFHLQDFYHVQTKVLNCLYFRQIYHRYDTVPDTYKSTYEWIFDGSQTYGKPSNDFTQWLEKDHGCYWINGKAGSGKSTLMKFIHNHPQTAKSLSLWAGGSQLVVSSCFFSNIGDLLEKTPAGLIRSLLYDMIDRHRHLIPVVVPDLCRVAANSNTNERLSEPTSAELIKAFRRILYRGNENLRFCFLIDGVDECEGDYSEILELISSAANTSHVKIIVSSRPITPCTAAFSQWPGLRLQDLTHSDITLYVEDRLKLQLEKRVGADAHALIADIVEKSFGVFLWIIIVVRSLQVGIQGMDRTEDLRRRIDELPSDLAALYSHMLGRIEPIYQRQASRLFQLVLSSVGVESGNEITVLQLSFADQSPAEAATAPFTEISTREESDRADEIEGRIQSRCCGLLEIRDRKYSRGLLKSVRRPTVAFLHRTVFEFLMNKSISQEILGPKRDVEFDPYLALASSCILLIKSLPPQRVFDRDSLAWKSTLDCLHYFSLLEEGNAVTTKLLDELDRARQHHWTKTFISGGKVGSSRGKETFWSVSQPFSNGALQTYEHDGSFLSITLTWGLSFYMQDKLEVADRIDPAQLNIFLHIAVRSLILTSSSISPSPARITGYAGIISALMEYGADPNCRPINNFHHSPWEIIVQHLQTLLRNRPSCAAFTQEFAHEKSYPRTLLGLIAVFIIGNADPNASAVQRTRRYPGVERPIEYCCSVLHILEGLPVSLVVPPIKRPSSPLDRHETDSELSLSEYKRRLIRMLKSRGARSEEWSASSGEPPRPRASTTPGFKFPASLSRMSNDETSSPKESISSQCQNTNNTRKKKNRLSAWRSVSRVFRSK